MLRSNRKNSPSSLTNGTNGTLPSYYNSQEPNGIPPTPSVPFPALKQRRRPKSITPRSKGPRILCCSSTWTCFVISTCTFMGTMLFVRHGGHPQAHPAISNFHRAMHKTLADQITNRMNYLPLDAQQQQQRRRGNVVPMLPPQPPKQGFYDVTVLGTGPAGLTAALFAARAGLSVLVLGSDAGSLLSETHSLENFPSFVGEHDNNNDQKGPQWLEQTKQQAAQWGATFAQAGLLVEKLQVMVPPLPHDQSTTTFALDIQGPQPSLQVHSRSVIVATGATGRRLGLEQEDTLWGKSVHSCAVCDGSSYVDKVVVVVGGGDAAVDGALLLSRYAREVILVHRRAQLRASNQRNIELLKTTPNIRVEVPFTIQKLETFQAVGHNGLMPQELLAAVDLVDVETGDTQRIACDGVFELIGSTPNTNWLQQPQSQPQAGPKLDEAGFLVLSNPTSETRTATTLEGVFAAGEVTDKIYRQAITAAAEGAQAAMDAERWLRNRPLPKDLHAEQSPPIPLQNVLMHDTTETHDSKLARVPPPLPQMKAPQLETESHAKKRPVLPSCDDLTQQECITELVNQYPVVVFSKPWCPYCRKALEAFAAEGLPEGNLNLHVVDLSQYGEKTHLIQSTLGAMTGRRTVPNVFVGGVSIGGGDETSKFHREGTLRAKLIDANAIVVKEETLDHESDLPACDDLTREDCLTKLVHQYPVVVFSKVGCPHCTRAFEALALDGLPEDSPKIHIINLTLRANQQQIQDQLQRMTGRRTVPNVFIGGETIGGGSETVLLQRSGELRAMLEKANAL